MPTGTIYDYDFLSPNYVSNKKRRIRIKIEATKEKKKETTPSHPLRTHTHAYRQAAPPSSPSFPLLFLVLHRRRQPGAWGWNLSPTTVRHYCTLSSPYFRLYIPSAAPLYHRRDMCVCVVFFVLFVPESSLALVPTNR